ncbi:MAG: hypothetical protein KBI01_01680 [Oscillospiraceae bacterium]|nr:hypothetical protein [Oscillospiraceae bacterium]
MITIFNRKEVLCTFSMKSQSDARNILAANNIDYTVNTTGNTMRNIGSGAIAIDRFQENSNLSCEYKIYVKKKDYDEALALLR